MAPFLAARFGVPWADLDAEIVRAAGRPIGALFAAEGEAGFRAREHGALRIAFAAGGGLVLACGGGVVAHAPSREALRGGATVVWLRVAPATAASRLGRDGLAARPLLAAPNGAGTEEAGAAALASLLAARAPLYAAAADLEVETDGRDAAACVEAAEAALRERWANFGS